MDLEREKERLAEQVTLGSFKPLDWQPVTSEFYGVRATMEKVVTFKLTLYPYPDGLWAGKFHKDYPELPLGVDSWFRSPSMIEVICPLDLLRNVKRKLQTHVNDINIWFEKSVLPSMIEKEQTQIARAKTLAAIVEQANSILVEHYTFGLFEE